MQSNTITLAVDLLNNDSTTDYDFTRFEEYQNRSVYIGEDHQLTSRDTLSLYRTFPKSAGNFKGMSKCAMKFSQDIEVTGVDGLAALVAPIILEVSASIPVGATLAQQLVARQRAIALLDDDTIMVALMNQLMV